MSDANRSSSVEAPEGSRGTGNAVKQKSKALYSANEPGTDSKLEKGAGGEVPERLSTNTISALDNVIEEGDLTAVLRLLENGVDVNATHGQDAIPPLILAINKGNEAIAQLLLDWGAEVTAREPWCKTPLFVAANLGRTEMVKMLLQSGADCNAMDITKYTALHYAALRGHSEIVQLLLQKGLEFNYMFNSLYTALHLAAILGH